MTGCDDDKKVDQYVAIIKPDCDLLCSFCKQIEHNGISWLIPSKDNEQFIQKKILPNF